MQLTKRKALEIWLELWEWLAATGERNMCKWEGWAKYGMMWGMCPGCEYTRQAKPYLPCPIWGECDHLGDLKCLAETSPYIKWRETITQSENENRSAAAECMVELIKSKLQEVDAPATLV
ncbi:MAG: hypothetical protein ABSB31_03125 [Dehalococcoidia bacterium]